MKFEKCLETSSLIYWNNLSYHIEVCENIHYRWLSFDGVIQSIMSRRKPWRLIFPHQYAMMMPLLFTRPNSILEVGLGGGATARFIRTLSTDVKFYSVEIDGAVIDCFQKYFSPRIINIDIITDDFIQCLKHKHHQGHSWYLFDIYNADTPNIEISKKVKNLLIGTPDSAFLSINLPEFDEYEIEQLLTALKTCCLNRYIYYFDIPHYKNLVIIVCPENFSPTFIKTNSLLPRYSLKRWQSLWLHGKKINDLHF